MTSRYVASKVSDSVLGRVGITIDWEKSLLGGIPDNWGIDPHPPMGSDWRQFLAPAKELVARNAVRPFHFYFDCQCNLCLLSSEAFELLGESAIGAISDVQLISAAFGKRSRDFRIGRLRQHLQWHNTDNSALIYAKSSFMRVPKPEYHIHGTMVERGEETQKDCPEPLETGLVYGSDRELRAVGFDVRSEIEPTRLCFALPEPPVVFAFRQTAYFRLDVATHLASLKEAGVNFPYAPIEVITA
ncbi:hypothetical protein [Rhodobacter sp. SY28-1]|uniref:hypothetical protein n=1 Tax=Rhodobacter sp. SY28-1 TaxID=2562317 RepID=UPI0010C029D4|nr:hypothetical protein [Rhodobacter sp. SY28-1]